MLNTFHKMTTTLDAMAVAFFEKCDQGNKGYITKEDLQRLHEEIQLSHEDLLLVFKNLDVQNKGFLTLHEFSGAFLEYKNQIVFNNEGFLGKVNEIYVEDAEDDEVCLQYMLKTCNLKWSTTSFMIMQKYLQEDNNNLLLAAWKDVIENLYKDVTVYQKNFRAMDDRVKRMEKHLNDYVTFHQELASELEEEKNKAIMWEKKRFAEKKQSFIRKISLKDREIQEMSEYKNELLQKINHMFRKKDQQKKSKNQLLKQQESYLEEIERQKEMITQLESHFEAFKAAMTKECERSFQEGFTLGQKIAAIQENGLLEEFRILQEICQTLKEGEVP